MKNTITLYTDKGKRGADIDRYKYEQIYRFIMEQVTIKKTITITQLLDLSFDAFPGQDRNSLARTLLDVKRDLILKRILKVQFDFERTQHITLAKRNKFFPLPNYLSSET